MLTGAEPDRGISTRAEIRPAATRSSSLGLGSRQFRVLVAMMLLMGVALRLWAYLSNNSLYIDEAALARNIIDRPFKGLFQPLDYGMVAPAGFLVIEKAITGILGDSEYALRLLPLLCGIASLPLFHAIAKRTLSQLGLLLANWMFALGIPFIDWSAQVKQYSSDVLGALLVWYALLELYPRRLNQRRMVLVTLGIAIVPWFSQPAVFVLAGALASVCVIAVLQNGTDPLRKLAPTLLLWLASGAAAVAYSFSQVLPADSSYLHGVWAKAFLPITAPPTKQLAWFWSTAKSLLGRDFLYPWWPLFLAAGVTGVAVLSNQRRNLSLFLFLPVVLTLIASAARLYPFYGRFVLFILPVFLLAVACGVQFLCESLRPRPQLLAIVPALVFFGLTILALPREFPPRVEENIRPVVEYVGRHRQQGDAIYVYYGAAQQFLYYSKRYGIREGEYMVGSCNRLHPRLYLREIDGVRGKRRVWLIFSHGLDHELGVLTTYSDEIGVRLQSFEIPLHETRRPEIPGQFRYRIDPASYAYLYDLSEPNRLAKTSAETFSLPTAETIQAAWPCYGTTGNPFPRFANR